MEERVFFPPNNFWQGLKTSFLGLQFLDTLRDALSLVVLLPTRKLCIYTCEAGRERYLTYSNRSQPHRRKQRASAIPGRAGRSSGSGKATVLFRRPVFPAQGASHARVRTLHEQPSHGASPHTTTGHSVSLSLPSAQKAERQPAKAEKLCTGSEAQQAKSPADAER